MMKQYRGQRAGIGCPSCPGVYAGKDQKASQAMMHGGGGANNGSPNSGSVGANPMGCVSAGSYRDFPLAMVFTPAQGYGNLYAPMEALENGTLFADLKLPFHGKFKI